MATTASNLSDTDERNKFDGVIHIVQGELSTFGFSLTRDPPLRLEYGRTIKRMADELRAKAYVGEISWEQAAKIAQDKRNKVMQNIRARSTPFGRAWAERLKPEGKTFNKMIAEKTIEKFGQNANFNSLTEHQKNQVYVRVVESGGTSRPSANTKIAKLSIWGQRLVFLSAAIVTYEIYTAEDKILETERQLSINGAGVIGGLSVSAMARSKIAGRAAAKLASNTIMARAGSGILAGLACGPGAPICVAIGAFVGGALAAWGAGALWGRYATG